MSISIYDRKDRRGGSYAKRKLKFVKAEMIREEYKTGVVTQAQLATKCDVSQPLMNQILSEMTYNRD